jgi:tryptophan synthase beta chain
LAVTIAVHLSQDELPTSWYNILSDLPVQLPPPLDPATQEPVSPVKLERIFAKELVRQEGSSESYVKIPEEVLEAYRSIGRPTPLMRARRLEELLDTPAEVYFKNESVNPGGSHKINTALAQAYYNKKEGVERLVTETGAGQWGSALALLHDLLRDEVRRIHGEGIIRSEAGPQGDDGDLGRQGPSLSKHQYEVRKGAASTAT